MHQSSIPNYENLITRIKNGDREVLVDLFKQNEAMIKKYVFEHQGEVEDAEDILQDAIIVLWKNARKPDFILDVKPSTYIFAICKNLWSKRWKKNQRQSHLEVIEVKDKPSTSENNLEELDLSIVRNLLNEMGDICRKILLMFYFDGFDMNTIAEANNLANSNVAKSKKHQCLKTLANQVKEKYNSTDFLN